MPSPKAWTFVQITGSTSGKKLVLDGSSAPHGRERKGPIVEDTWELRKKTSYPAGNNQPTVHVFGEKFGDHVLKGRFRDATLGGTGSCNAKIREVKQFASDAQRVRITWGDIATYRGIITKLKFGRESENACSWEMTIEIHQDLDLQDHRSLPPQLSLPSSASQIQTILNRIAQACEMSKWFATPPPTDVVLQRPLTDILSDITSLLVAPVGIYINTAIAVQSFENATSLDLQRIRSALGQITNTVATLRATVEGAGDDYALAWQTSSTTTTWARNRAEAEYQVALLLKLIADADRAAEIAQRGKADRSVVANAGDSWESISQAAYNSIGQARAIADANGRKYGEMPVAGRRYILPASSS